MGTLQNNNVDKDNIKMYFHQNIILLMSKLNKTFSQIQNNGLNVTQLDIFYVKKMNVIVVGRVNGYPLGFPKINKIDFM